MKKLYFRVDMNPDIATGHVMRCLSIADAARAMGMESVFILADENATVLLAEKHYPFIVLGTPWDDMDDECDKICSILRDLRVQVLLIDSYRVTANYLSRLSKVTRTVYIDDINKMIYPVHVLICYANYWEKFEYEKRYGEAYYNGRIAMLPDFYLGCRYAPLREEFSKLTQKEIRAVPKRLLILSGGTDPFDAAGRILDSIELGRYAEITVICGRMNRTADALRTKYREKSNIHIMDSVDSAGGMVDCMMKADIAISAGGTTLYELCATGTPTITFSFADNQLCNVRTFEENGIMEYAGDVRTSDVGKNVRRLLGIYAQRSERQRRSEAMRALVDGLGARRICGDLARNLDDAE